MPSKDEPERNPPQSRPPARPQFPTGASKPRTHRQAQPDASSSADVPVIEEDDDAVIVPAPPPSVFATQRSHGSTASPSLFFRRTIVPILLTTGLLFGTIGGLWFTLDPDEPMRIGGSSIWFPATLFCIALVMLTLAILNMMQLRHLLRTGVR